MLFNQSVQTGELPLAWKFQILWQFLRDQKAMNYLTTDQYHYQSNTGKVLDDYIYMRELLPTWNVANYSPMRN